MKHFLAFALSLLALIAYGSESSRSRMDKAIDRLDRTLSQRKQYIDLHLASIDSLRQLLPLAASPQESARLEMALGDSYRLLNNDSALYHYSLGFDLAESIGDKNLARRLRLKRAVILPLSGFIKDAVDEFERIDRAAVPDSQLALYYESARQMYSYLASFFDEYPSTRDHWNRLSAAYRDSFLAVAPPDAPLTRFLVGERLFDEGKYIKAKQLLTELVNDIPAEGNLAARANHKLAMIATEQGDSDEACYRLALSAIADTKGAVLEVMALQELGQHLADAGDISRAYSYLSVALSNAVECNASMRIIQSSSALPIIEQMHTSQINRWRNTIYVVIFLMALMLIMLVVLTFYMRRQMKRMAQLQQKLRNSNEVKEVYISQFFRLCSIYIDKLNQFCKIANRKISSGQVDDLYKITKSGKLVEEQSEEFYKLFDDAFLHIYPTFVDDVNKLLREKITLRDGELLNNDLRILAFMRLGLEDTNQVALILNYSVNTIYAYRNKLRNRAYDRDNFERDIMNIGAFNF